MEPTADAERARHARGLYSLALALALGVVSLGFVLAGRAIGGSPHWYAYTIPIWLVVNISVVRFGVLQRWPRWRTVFYSITIVIFIAVNIAVFRDWPR